MRFDLTLNEFTKELYFGNKLSVYDHETWRPYCHVLDFAQAIDLVINSKKNITTNQIYNVGSDKNNHTKKDIIDTISKYIPNPKVRYVNESIDKRNYRVNFAKIKKELHFNPKYSIDYGIREIIESLEKNYFKFDISNQYGTTKLKHLKKTYNLALIGTGKILNKHFEVIKTFNNFRVVAIHSRTEIKAKKFCAHNHLNQIYIIQSLMI